MSLSLSNDLLLGIGIGIALTFLFQIAQRTARSAEQRLPCLLVFLLMIGAIIALIWWQGV